MERFEEPVDEITRISTQLVAGQIHDDIFRAALRQEGRHADGSINGRIDAALQLAYMYDRLAYDDSQEPGSQVYFYGLWRDAVAYAANLASSNQDYFFDTLSALRDQDAGTTSRIVSYLQQNAPAQVSQTRNVQKLEKPTKSRASTTDVLRRFGRPAAVAAGVVASSILAPHTAIAADNNHVSDQAKHTKTVDSTPALDLSKVSVGQLAAPSQPSIDTVATVSKNSVPTVSRERPTTAPAYQATDTVAAAVTLSEKVPPAPSPSRVLSSQTSVHTSSPRPAVDLSEAAVLSPNQGDYVAERSATELPFAKDTIDLTQLGTEHSPSSKNPADATTASALTTSDFKISGDHHTIAIEDIAGAPSAQAQLEAPTKSIIPRAPDLGSIQSAQPENPQPYTPPVSAPQPPTETPPAAAPAPAEHAQPAPVVTPEAIIDPTLAGETKWTASQLERVKNNLPVYLEAQHQTGVPWEVLAAVHQREHGLAVSNPANGQGVYQLFSGTERFTPGDISHDEFLRQTILAANFIKGKAAESRVSGALSLDNPDKVKDVLFSYNGRAAAYIRQATNLGFTLGAEGSPYVMNLADDRRDSTKNPAWGQILTDGGPLGKANHEPGAWLLVDGLARIDTQARAQVSDNKKQEQPAQVATEKKPEQSNSGATWELPTTAAVSSPFGGRGEGGVHRGIDYATPTGTPLVAAIGGKVTVVVTADVRTQPFCTSALDSIGASVDDIKDPQQKEVRITAEIDGATYTVIYAHMSKVTVAPNQIINPGDVIGETGASGCVTGPHLHFEVQKNGVPVDPTTLYGKPVSISSKQS